MHLAALPSSRPARGYPDVDETKKAKRKTKVFTILPRASALYFIRYHEQVTKHRQTQLDRRWGARRLFSDPITKNRWSQPRFFTVGVRGPNLR